MGELLEKTISMSCLKRFGKFELANGELIRRLLIYSKNVAAITKAKLEETQLFYQIIQNQLHFATTGKTAAEIIYGRADCNKSFMGLTTWKNSPQGKILKSDVTIAKNYLNQEEVSKLNRLVNMFIDFAELRALNQQIMIMKDWLKQIDKFLDYTDQQIYDTQDKFFIVWLLLKLRLNMRNIKFSEIRNIYQILIES